jgi:hypothetical protein
MFFVAICLQRRACPMWPTPWEKGLNSKFQDKQWKASCLDVGWKPPVRMPSYSISPAGCSRATYLDVPLSSCVHGCSMFASLSDLLAKPLLGCLPVISLPMSTVGTSLPSGWPARLRAAAPACSFFFLHLPTVTLIKLLVDPPDKILLRV